jgi:hypothetical protein
MGHYRARCNGSGEVAAITADSVVFSTDKVEERVRLNHVTARVHLDHVTARIHLMMQLSYT